MSPMAVAGEEGVGSMGNDSPLAVLSDKNKPLFNYFKQLFAQVTNPPIDPIREAIVMSLNSFIGPKPNLLDINAVNPPMRLEVTQPVLDFDDMARLRAIEKHTHGKFREPRARHHLPAGVGQGRYRSQAGVVVRRERGCAQERPQHPDHHRPPPAPRARRDSRVARAVRRAPPPGARGLRTTVGLVVETGSAREVHHFAVLAGYGAEAVHPYLAMETLAAMHAELPGDLSAEKAVYNYVKAIGKGLSKIMSKMGVSTYMSYCGAQLFEAVGLAKPFVEKYFRGTASQVEGIGVFEVAEEALRMHRAAFSDDPVLEGMLDAAASTRGACAARSTCGRPTRSPSCSTPRVPASSRPTRSTRSSSTTRAAAT